MSADRIVQAIIRDIRGRKGLGNEWDAIDSRTKVEIIRAWRKIVIVEDHSNRRRSPAEPPQ